MAQEGFPLHYLVWNNQYLELDRELQKKEVSGEFCFAADVFFNRCVFCAVLHCADAACVFGSAAGCGAPGSERAHPAGAGRVSGPPGINPGTDEILCRPDILQLTGLDQ